MSLLGLILRGTGRVEIARAEASKRLKSFGMTRHPMPLSAPTASPQSRHRPAVDDVDAVAAQLLDVVHGEAIITCPLEADHHVGDVHKNRLPTMSQVILTPDGGDAPHIRTGEPEASAAPYNSHNLRFSMSGGTENGIEADPASMAHNSTAVSSGQSPTLAMRSYLRF